MPSSRKAPAPVVGDLEKAAAEVYRVLMHRETPPSAKASLLREYRMTKAALDARPKAKESKIDELAERRKARRAQTS